MKTRKHRCMNIARIVAGIVMATCAAIIVVALTGCQQKTDTVTFEVTPPDIIYVGGEPRVKCVGLEQPAYCTEGLVIRLEPQAASAPTPDIPMTRCVRDVDGSCLLQNGKPCMLLPEAAEIATRTHRLMHRMGAKLELMGCEQAAPVQPRQAIPVKLMTL